MKTLWQATIEAIELVRKQKDFFEEFGFGFAQEIASVKEPVVVGSGNALSCGKLIFKDKPAFFADEADYRKFLNCKRPVILISASGKKDA